MASLSHILASQPSVSDVHAKASTSAAPAAGSNTPAKANGQPDQLVLNSVTRKTDAATSTTPAAAAPAQSNYPGNKMRHLKKEDGIPLWRKDIQYDFLKAVFYDQTRCFTKYSEKTQGFTFAEVYIDAMAKSSKCSKILKEKLLSDTDGAISMAMVCLLVNLGRMNTTLNFFPEMRAQLRTYHSIPALQAQQDPNAYKQLQDAPRLKSILKGATEDEPQPWTMEDIKAAAKPRTNAVNLIFVMSQLALKVSDLHFPPPRDFYDLIMRPSLSSESRARAFLWLLWWYLESNFTAEDAKNNPFGPGQYPEGKEGTDTIPQIVPPLESLTEEQAERENIDTEEEKTFGEVKRKERIAILASDPSPAMVALKRARNQKSLGQSNRSDDEGSEAGWYRGSRPENPQTRSPSPYGGDMKIRALLNDDGSGDDTPRRRPGRGNWRANRVSKDSEANNKTIHILPHLAPDATARLRPESSAAPHRNGGLDTSLRDHIPTPSYQAQKRHRGVTQHQSALNIHRRAQMDYMLDRSIRDIHLAARRAREQEGSVLRAWKRIKMLPADYDSDEEMIRVRKARDRDKDEDVGRRGARDDDLNGDGSGRRSRMHLAGYSGVTGEDYDDDIGEEVKSLASVFRKVCRRLDRWQTDEAPGEAILQRKRRAAELYDRDATQEDVDMDDGSDDEQ